MNRLFAFFLTMIVTLQLATAAQAEWVIERMSSAVWASQNGADWRDVQVGERFASSTWIQTGERGQVIFARGSERIVFRPGTVATLESQGRNTNVGPIRGSVLLSIDRERGGRTVVETPHLAAVVLGTVFEVTMNPQSSSVRVDQGSVAVEHGGRRAVLEQGQQGVVQANSTQSILIEAALVTSLVANGTGIDFSTGALVAAPENRGQAISADKRNSGNDAGSNNGNAGNAAGNGNDGNASGNGNDGNASGNGNDGNASGNGNDGNASGNGNAGNASGNGNGGDDEDDD